MFFKNSKLLWKNVFYNLIFIFLPIVYSSEKKITQPLPCINNDYTNVIKTVKMASNSKQSRHEIQNKERRRTSFSRVWRKSRLYKPALNKVMTTHEQLCSLAYL